MNFHTRHVSPARQEAAGVEATPSPPLFPKLWGGRYVGLVAYGLEGSRRSRRGRKRDGMGGGGGGGRRRHYDAGEQGGRQPLPCTAARGSSLGGLVTEERLMGKLEPSPCAGIRGRGRVVRPGGGNFPHGLTTWCPYLGCHFVVTVVVNSQQIYQKKIYPR